MKGAWCVRCEPRSVVVSGVGPPVRARVVHHGATDAQRVLQCHITSLYHKLQVANDFELSLYALDKGLVEPD